MIVLHTENLMSAYARAGDLVGFKGQKGDREKGEIVCDITTSFVVLLAIFFPSCTGVFVLCNHYCADRN